LCRVIENEKNGPATIEEEKDTAREDFAVAGIGKKAKKKDTLDGTRASVVKTKPGGDKS